MANRTSYMPDAMATSLDTGVTIDGDPYNPISPQVITETVSVVQEGGYGGIYVKTS